MAIETASKTEKTETLTSRYFPSDLEKVNAMSKIFGVKPRTVPVICVRLVFPIVNLFESHYMREVVKQVYCHFAYLAPEKHDIHKEE